MLSRGGLLLTSSPTHFTRTPPTQALHKPDTILMLTWNHGAFRCHGCCDCSSPHGSAIRVCGLHSLPGDSAPSIRAHTTTKESLVSYNMKLVITLCKLLFTT